MRRLELKSPAKLNLYLKIIKKRRDGYHEILTLFERINLCDLIILEKHTRGIKVFLEGEDIPLKENLAYRAGLLISKKIGKKLGVKIRILKHIPIGAGLGGGSSNAATVLLGINHLYELGIDKGVLYEWGASLGSDVNFFLSEEKFALGYGRGEKLSLLKNIETRLWHLVIYPGFPILTSQIYRAFDGIGLTKKATNVRILIDSLRKGNIGKIGNLFFNSLEPVVLKNYPLLSFWREKLNSTSAKGVLISGSGSSIFGLYENRKEVERVRRELERFKKREVFFVVSTDC